MRTSAKDRTEFAKRLSIAMVLAGVTSAELARRMDLNPRTIYNWVHGKRYPDPRTLHQLGRALSINAVWLAFGHGEMYEEARTG